MSTPSDPLGWMTLQPLREHRLFGLGKIGLPIMEMRTAQRDVGLLERL
jgi:hypothetical protein